MVGRHVVDLAQNESVTVQANWGCLARVRYQFVFGKLSDGRVTASGAADVRLTDKSLATRVLAPDEVASIDRLLDYFRLPPEQRTSSTAAGPMRVRWSRGYDVLEVEEFETTEPTLRLMDGYLTLMGLAGMRD